MASIHQAIEELVVQAQFIEHRVSSPALSGPAGDPRSDSGGISDSQHVDIKAIRDSFARSGVLRWMNTEQACDHLQVTLLRPSRGHIKGWPLVRPSSATRRVTAGMKEGAVETDLLSLSIAQ